MKASIFLLVAAGCTGLAFALTQSGVLTVNGKRTPNGAIVQGGKTYVSLDALKEGGAQVSTAGGQVTVNFVPLGGRDQVDAIEGGLGEWIQNEAWRVRIESAAPIANPFGRGPGLEVKAEFRNLSTKPISPFASGMDKLQVIDDKGQVLAFVQASFADYFNAIAPGGAAVATLRFGDSANKLTELGKPEKLLIFFRNSGGKKHKDFRVFLKAPS